MSRRRKIRSFELHFNQHQPTYGGIYIMKNVMMKNLAKSMADYGELLNRIGF